MNIILNSIEEINERREVARQVAREADECRVDGWAAWQWSRLNLMAGSQAGRPTFISVTQKHRELQLQFSCVGDE